VRDLGRFDVIVLGAGPAGLGAAWEAAAGGARVLVVERDDATGGLCRTHERDGFRFDLGGHRFITADRDLLDRVVRLAGDDLLLAERTSEVALLGRRFRYPLELGDLVKNLPPGLAVKALASWARSRLRPRGAPAATFEDWAVERFGRVLFDLFIGPYTAKVWGEHPRELSTEWAAQRISLLDLGEAARHLLPRLFAGRAAATPRTHARTFLYPRLGMGQLFDRIRDEAQRRGATVVHRARAASFERDGPRLSSVTLETAEGPALARADWVLSTIPLPALLPLALGAEGAALAAPFAFRPVRFIDVALARPTALPTTWCYVGDERLAAGRLQEPRRRSAHMAPPGATSLMIEVPHAPGDAVDRATDDELLGRMKDELRPLVDLDRDVRFAFSVRAPEAYPVHRRGTEDARAAALAALGRVPNLRTFGRQGAFRFIFSDAALRMGLDAAAGALAGAPPPNEVLARVQSARTLVEVESVVDGASLGRA
jgi:protoporphyrinogen oxidase